MLRSKHIGRQFLALLRAGTKLGKPGLNRAWTVAAWNDDAIF